MHETTAIVLLVVVLGQIFIFTIAGIAMWLAGEFGEPPRWRRWMKQRNAGKASGPQAAAHDGLLTLHHDRLIRTTDDGRKTTDGGLEILDFR